MSKLLPIITHPDPSLRSISAEVPEDMIASKEFQDMLSDMELTMEKKDGIGLAAPQVGLGLRVVIIHTDNGNLKCINPRITKKSFGQVYMEEGCLSVPLFFGQVRRPKWIHCEFADEYGKLIKIKAGDLLARIFQHEIDHLDGILFIDKAKELREIADKKAVGV